VITVKEIQRKSQKFRAAYPQKGLKIHIKDCEWRYQYHSK